MLDNLFSSMFLFPFSIYLIPSQRLVDILNQVLAPHSEIAFFLSTSKYVEASVLV